jgi:tetratricopeptide (TPR) repeat protein
MYKSRSTQGLVIFAVAVSVLLTLIINENQKRKLTIINFAWLTSNLIIFTFAILSLFQVVKVTNILSKENGSFESRILHWKSAISMFVNNPITGVGVDSFGEFFPLHRFKFEDGRLDTYTNNAHNVFLQALATGGIILFSVYALTSLLTFKAIINIFRFTKIDLQIGVLIALYIAFTVQSLISIDQIGLAVWGWTFSGYLVAYENKLIKTKQKIKVNSKGTIKILSKFTYSITTLAISISLIPNLNSMLQIWEIRSTLNKIGNSEASISDVNRLYEIAVSYNEPSMRMQAVGGLLNLGMIDQALKLSLDSTKKFPKSVYAWDAVASIYEQTNRWNLAVSYRKESLRLDPQNIKMQELLISDQSKS